MKGVGISEQWLQKQLINLRLTLADVFYVELQSDGSLYIDKRSEK